MSYFVYVLQSDVTKKFYIGQTKDVEARLQKHNQGESQATKSGRPWRLLYKEFYETRSEAVLRERFLKSPQGWKELKRIKELK